MRQIKYHILTITVTLLALSAFSTSLAIAQAPQMSEEKTALYTKYYEKRQGGIDDEKVAYGLAQDFLQRFGADDDTYVKAVRKFVAKYEANQRELGFGQAFVAKDYPKAFEFGRQILSKEPENFKIMVQVVQAGYLNSQNGNTSLNADSMTIAKQALQLLDANKVTDPAPMPTIEDARGYLNFALGSFLIASSPGEAALVLVKALNSSPAYKIDPTTYFLLGTAVYNGEYQQLYTEYKEKYAGKDESPEQKALLERLNHTGDRAVDAMARAVALATKPEQQAFKKKALAQLTDIYKDFHNNSDAGLNELIAAVLSKPLPE
jgi:hypothetical protein